MPGRKYTLRSMTSPDDVINNSTLTFGSGRGVFYRDRTYRLMKGGSDDGKPLYQLYMPDQTGSNFIPLIDIYDREIIIPTLIKRRELDPDTHTIKYPNLVELLRLLTVNESTIDDFVDKVLRQVFPLPISFRVDDGYVGVERGKDTRTNGYLSRTLDIGGD